MIRAAVLLCLLLAALPLRAEEAAWSIFGLRPGMTEKQVRSALGPPTLESAKTATGQVLSWRKGVRGKDDPRVWLDARGQVTFVMGSRLERGGERVLEGGATPEQLRAVLGDGGQVREEGAATICSFPAEKITAVMAGKPAVAVVFGLGQEPSAP